MSAADEDRVERTHCSRKLIERHHIVEPGCGVLGSVRKRHQLERRQPLLQLELRNDREEQVAPVPHVKGTKVANSQGGRRRRLQHAERAGQQQHA